MINWIHRNIIVPAIHVELARDLCATIAGSGGANMFTTPLSKLDSATPEYYISSGLIDEQFANILPLDEFIQSEENMPASLVRVKLPETETIKQILESMEIAPDPMLDSLLTTIIVTNGDIHTTLTNLNLQLYSEPNENLSSESSNSM